MSNLILIRGLEIDIPKTMLQHHITNVIDLEKHLKKLIKQRRNSFRLIVLRKNATTNNDAYKMYISHRYLAKPQQDKEFKTSDERITYKQFFIMNGYKYSDGTYRGNIGTFMAKFDENKQHISIKNPDYTMMYDLYEEMYVF